MTWHDYYARYRGRVYKVRVELDPNYNNYAASDLMADLTDILTGERTTARVLALEVLNAMEVLAWVATLSGDDRPESRASRDQPESHLRTGGSEASEDEGEVEPGRGG